jgi:hypothetical protein
MRKPTLYDVWPILSRRSVVAQSRPLHWTAEVIVMLIAVIVGAIALYLLSEWAIWQA